jgi:transcriptional regulator with XRE-family HTH domain
MIDLVSIGKKIAALRTGASLSQDRLAEILMVSRQAVSAWENGKSAPSIDNVIELSKVFSVPFESILCLDETPEIDPLDPYEGHEREYIVRSVIAGSLQLDFGNLLYHSTGGERLQLLRAVEEGKIKVPLAEFKDKLSPEEMRYIAKGGKRG